MDCLAEPTTERWNRWISYFFATLVLAVLGGHVLLTLVYLSPPNIAQEHMGVVAERYMKPLFHQNWHLFSPNPGISTRKLAVRCRAGEDEWSDYFDPTTELVARHNANRFSGVGKLLYVYRAVGDDLRKVIEKRMGKCRENAAQTPDVVVDCSPDAVMPEIMGTAELDLAVRYGAHVCEDWGDASGAPITAVQLKLLEFFPIKYADRETADASGKQWDKVYEIELPVFEGE